MINQLLHFSVVNNLSSEILILLYRYEHPKNSGAQKIKELLKYCLRSLLQTTKCFIFDIKTNCLLLKTAETFFSVENIRQQVPYQHKTCTWNITYHKDPFSLARGLQRIIKADFHLKVDSKTWLSPIFTCTLIVAYRRGHSNLTSYEKSSFQFNFSVSYCVQCITRNDQILTNCNVRMTSLRYINISLQTYESNWLTEQIHEQVQLRRTFSLRTITYHNLHL